MTMDPNIKVLMVLYMSAGLNYIILLKEIGS